MKYGIFPASMSVQQNQLFTPKPNFGIYNLLRVWKYGLENINSRDANKFESFQHFTLIFCFYWMSEWNKIRIM